MTLVKRCRSEEAPQNTDIKNSEEDKNIKSTTDLFRFRHFGCYKSTGTVLTVIVVALRLGVYGKPERQVSFFGGMVPFSKLNLFCVYDLGTGDKEALP